MFGYIRPDMGELKVKEFGRFRACYCGLCHVLGREYGIFSRYILNYDFVFLAMLLDREVPEYCLSRCAGAYFRKRCVCVASETLSRCAGYSVILAYWKLRDSEADDGFLEAAVSRVKRLFLRGAYRRAEKKYPKFSGDVKRLLSELSVLEDENEPSLDKTADKFASLLAAASDYVEDEKDRRVLSELIYHVGRIIYIADAVQDVEEDMTAGRYNPLIPRFSMSSPELSEEEKEIINLTFLNSQNRIFAAFELMEKTYWTSILKNILYRGIPLMCTQVLSGTYSNKSIGLPEDLNKFPFKMGEDR